MQPAQKRKNGVFYTPASMARLLASRAIDGEDFLVLDPACGDGVLLKAAAERHADFRVAPRLRLVGCDRFKAKRALRSLEFVQSDFFAYETNEKFDTILTNPPYVQSARIRPATRERYHTRYAKSLGFSHNLDLWAYFLIKCTEHLNVGGTIAAILPWSFLEAEYAQKVRNWLAKSFKRIEVLVLEGAHFEDTVKRVLLVWLYDYGSPARDVKLGYTHTCAVMPDFQSVPMKAWNSDNVAACFNDAGQHICHRLAEAGFSPMKEYVDISIGVVTGANRYFIHSKREAEGFGFPEGSTLPILTSVRDLDLVAGSKSPDKMLIRFKRMTRKRKRYVEKGRRLHLNARVHCARRESQTGSWYDIDPGTTPDAFFTYRVARIPYLILNPDGYQCTNALHRVCFKGVSRTERKWIQLSLLSIFGQLSLEMGARHYGNGILKIEPRLLKMALVYTSRTRIPDDSYRRILRHISNVDKESACAEATRLVAKEANLSASLVADAIATLNNLRKRRGALEFQLATERFLP
jgi:adenine-specific DNA-methyltransferase